MSSARLAPYKEQRLPGSTQNSRRIPIVSGACQRQKSAARLRRDFVKQLTERIGIDTLRSLYPYALHRKVYRSALLYLFDKLELEYY